MSKKKKSKSYHNNNSNNSNYKNDKVDYIEKKKQESKGEIIEVENKKDITDTTSLSIIESSELNDLIDEDLGLKKKKVVKKRKHFLVHLFLILLLFLSLGYFGICVWNKDTSIFVLINSLILTLFTIIYTVVCITSNHKNKSMIMISGLLLFSYFLININQYLNVFHSPIKTVPDFTGKSLTEVVKWAEKNDIQINQDYEYSDMVSEYNIISQSINDGSSLKGLTEFTVSVSEGPNPSKEIVVPSMVSWDDDRVINYVLDNYLSNVEVEFVESDKAQNTLIEQSKTGNMKRDEELKLTFSYGEELGFSEVKLIDFKNKSKFEIEFYMKKNQLRYEFDSDFSSKVKKGYGVSQNIKAGDFVKINDEMVKVTISRGPKIKVPDLKKMSVTEITEWAIKNKLKVEFIDKYDDSIEDEKVISASYNYEDIIEQGTVIKVIISRGALTMPKFKSLSEFRDWADKYEIKYEEKHEFSDSVEIGEVISYSYKIGEAIKNDDTIIVKISDGKKREVPNLKGLTKSEAIAKLEKLDLKYNFVYKASNSVSKDKVISQSISAGSEISSGTTITITLSSGKKDESSSSSSNSSPIPSPSPKPTPTPSVKPSPTPSCDSYTVYIYDELISNTPATTCSKIKSAYPKLSFSCSYTEDSGLANGMLKNSSSVDGKTFTTCDSISLVIVKNS